MFFSDKTLGTARSETGLTNTPSARYELPYSPHLYKASNPTTITLPYIDTSVLHQGWTKDLVAISESQLMPRDPVSYPLQEILSAISYLTAVSLVHPVSSNEWNASRGRRSLTIPARRSLDRTLVFKNTH